MSCVDAGTKPRDPSIKPSIPRTKEPFAEAIRAVSCRLRLNPDGLGWTVTPRNAATVLRHFRPFGEVDDGVMECFLGSALDRMVSLVKLTHCRPARVAVREVH